ncbi:MAG TPA: hypothetical protein VM736_08060 [Gemmatimonadales bacterium]|nr:hypothetical protein [Gemmatimonadales bacterium]
MRIGAGLGLALGIVTCTDRSVTGPKHRANAALDFRALAAASVPGTPHIPVDSLEITFRRADGSVALDDRLGFKADTLAGDSAVIRIDLELSQSTETFTVVVRAFGAGLDWYHFAGTAQVAAGATAQPTLTGQYVGPGANAARVVMRPVDTTAVGGTVFPLRALAYGAAGDSITGVPIGYRVSDSTRAGIAYLTSFSAQLTAALSLRDSVWVVAETPTHLKDSTRVRLVPQPAKLLVVSGNSQTGVVSNPLKSALVVRVLDALGGGFKGDSVSWSVTAGQATLSAAISVTDDTGYAQIAVTPLQVGALTVQATAKAITGPIAQSPASFTAISVTGPSLYFGYTTVTTGLGQISLPEYVSASSPVMGSPLVVTLQRSDSLVASQGQVFGLSTTVDTIPVGYTSTSSNFTLTGRNVGSALLIARAQGYTQAAATVAVGQPQLASFSGILSLYVGAPPTSVFVYTEDQTGAARSVASPITVAASSTAPTIAVPDSMTLVVPVGADGAYVGVQGLLKGSTAIVFSSPNYKSDTLQVSVDTAQLVLSWGVVLPAGTDSALMHVQIPFNTASAVVVTLASSDTTLLKVPATVMIPPNASNVYFYVKRGTNTGTVTVTATATGFRAATPVSVPVQ